MIRIQRAAEPPAIGPHLALIAVQILFRHVANLRQVRAAIDVASSSGRVPSDGRCSLLFLIIAAQTSLRC